MKRSTMSTAMRKSLRILQRWKKEFYLEPGEEGKCSTGPTMSSLTGVRAGEGQGCESVSSW